MGQESVHSRVLHRRVHSRCCDDGRKTVASTNHDVACNTDRGNKLVPEHNTQELVPEHSKRAREPEHSMFEREHNILVRNTI